MIFLIDNYDSFSYNVYQLTGSIDPNIRVIRNDELSVDEILSLAPSHIIIGPGPGRPSDAGICEELIRTAAGKIPILGICLGHQAICEAFGGVVGYAKRLMHGKKSTITVDGSSAIFRGLSGEISAARYHSLAAIDQDFPEELAITARTSDGEIMAVEHKKYPVFGLQFHPESILTDDGEKIMRNFLEIG